MKLVKIIFATLVGPLLLLSMGLALAKVELGPATTAVEPADVNAAAYNTAIVGRLSGNTTAVDFSGDNAFVGMGNRLIVLNITTPEAPAEAGRSDQLPQNIQDVVVSGDYAYVADEAAGLYVIDINPPSIPQVVGHVDLLGEAYGVAVSGNYAYVAAAWGGYHVVDISDPANPTRVAGLHIQGWHEKVVVAGDLAFFTNADGTYNGLRIVDISDPLSPTEAGFAATPTYAKDVAVAGDYAYVAAHGHGLRVISIQDPTKPAEVGFFDTPGQALGIKVANDLAYIADGLHGGLQIVNVSTPGTPSFVSSWLTPAIVSDVAIRGGCAYLANWGEGLRVIDMQPLASPNEVGYFDSWPNYASKVDVEGDRAYLADQDGGMRIVDISDPANPILIDTFDPVTSDITAVNTEVTYAYVGDRDGTFRTVELSGIPVQTGFADLGPGEAGAVNAIAVGEGEKRAYAAHGNYGMRIMDITREVSPTEVGYVRTPDYLSDVVAAGDYVYLAATSSLRIVDVHHFPFSNTVGVLDIGASFVTVDPPNPDGESKQAYVVDGRDFRIIDVLTPTHPKEVGYYRLPSGSNARGISVEGDLAYIAQSGIGVRVIDVGDPQHPIEVGYYHTAREAEDVDVADGLAYVANGDNGFFVMEFTAATRTIFPGQSATLVYFNIPGYVKTLYIPGGAFPMTVTLLLTPYDDILPPPGYVSANHAFNLVPYVGGVAQYGMSFGRPVTLTVTYSDTDLFAAIRPAYADGDMAQANDESQLMWIYWRDNGYVDAATSCTPPSTYIRDTAGNVLHLPICAADFYRLVVPKERQELFLPLATR